MNAKKHTCDKKTVRKEWIEELAVKTTLEILSDEAVIEYLTDRIYDLQGAENPRVPRLKEQLSDVEKRIGNIVQAIEQGIRRKSGSDSLKKKRRSLKSRFCRSK